MAETKQQLNEAQLKAVLHGKGPLLIIAGAGTGKTTVITQRIAHLILDKGIAPDKILALTFTEKSAAEMEERVDKALPYGYVDLWISTFHSFCEKILRMYGHEIGLPTDFKLLTQTEQWLLVRQNLERFDLNYYRPRGNPTKFIHDLLSHFSRAKDEEIGIDEYKKYADAQMEEAAKSDDPVIKEEAIKAREVAGAYETYQQLLLENSYLDFGDLITYALNLVRTRASVCQKLQTQFEYVLVDEFQDTNYAQYELIKYLAGDNSNLTVVGDDDQSIYKFRGASISNILQFKNDYPKSKEILLFENYRSAQNILDLSYNFIQLNNPNRLEVALNKGKKKNLLIKKLKALPEKVGEIEHLHFDTLEAEVAGVVKKIADIKKERPELSWADFAILVRANDSATHFTNYLRKTDIPFQFLALKGLYTKPIILDVIAYFRLLDNYHEGPAMFRIMSSSFMDLEYQDMLAIINFAHRKTISIYQAMRRISEVGEMKNDKTISKTNHLIKMLDLHTEFAKRKGVAEVFIGFLQQSKILDQLLKEESADDRMNMEFLQSFYKRIQKFEESFDEPSLKNFMIELDMELESGERGTMQKDSQLGPDTLTIMTIHSSKGLEYEYVFLPNMVDKKFPTIERSEVIEIPQPLVKDIVPEGDIHIQEERRLFYVAMTRAKRGLYFSSAEDYGGLRAKKLSRFLVELNQTSPFFELSEASKSEKKLEPIKLEIKQSSMVKFQPPLPSKFSFSQIASFMKCPYQYKLSFVYHIPMFGKAVFSYGKTMHSTLEHFFTMVADKMTRGQADIFSAIENTSGKGTIGELVEKEEIFRLLDECWIDEWYETQDQKVQYQKQARESLNTFYDKIADVEPRVKFLEKPFNLKLLGSNNEIYTIRGVIDRVDELADGSWHIVDYKTGSAKEKLEWADRMQLLIYQVAAVELFNAKVSKLTYYYLDSNVDISFLGEQKEIDKLKKELVETIEAIKESNFSATPGWQCGFCDYRDICEYKQ